MVHADAEEAVVLPVGHAAECVVLAIAMRLRALHDGDLRIVEITGERAQPVAAHFVVGIDDGDDLGARIGFLEPEVQRAGLEARPRIEVVEAELRAELRAMRLDRLPDFFVLRVVVDHEHFVVLVIERRERIERQDHHLGRLVVAGEMDRHERLRVDGIRRQQLELAKPSRPPHHFGELEAVDQEDQDDRELRREQQHEHAPVERVEIEVVRQRRHPDEDRRGHLEQRKEEHEAERAEADEVPREAQNIGISAISDASPAFHGQLGSSMTVPVNANFCARFALNTPQYAPTRPSFAAFHGWSIASMT